MKLYKEDIATAKEMAKTLQQSKNDELVVVGNLLSHLLAQRTWVGLTDEEANELWESTDSDWELMKRTEAKLKEKNT